MFKKIMDPLHLGECMDVSRFIDRLRPTKIKTFLKKKLETFGELSWAYYGVSQQLIYANPVFRVIPVLG